MGRGVGNEAGGILGLHRLLREHGEAIRRDLFVVGRSLDDLGTKRLTWLDLRAFTSLAGRDTALFRAINGEMTDWPLAVQLQARVVDLLAAGNWQRGRGKGPKPKPVPRPMQKKRIGTTVMSLDDMDKFLGYSPRK